MKRITVHDKTFELSIPFSEIDNAIAQISVQMDHDLKGKDVVMLCILNGSFMFAADLMKKLTTPCRVTFVKVTSYQGTSSEGKVKELLEDTQIDEGRIASEIVIFADKICTDEEVVRLRSHVEHMKATLQSDDSGIGRKLDFIAQEMNREANTILSKANDLETSNIGIELKTEIEKVREQIQNIE